MNKPIKYPEVKPRQTRLFIVTKNGAYPYKDALNVVEITAFANTSEWGIVAATNPIQAVSVAAIHFPELNIPLPKTNHG